MTTFPSSPSLRDDKANNCTMIMQVAPLAWSGNVLLAAYDLLAKTVFAKIDPKENGVVVAAASPQTGDFGGGVITRRDRGAPWSGLVGRHDATSITLPSDAALSLRHVILIAKVTDDGCPIFRVLDLRSGTGMFDADGAPHLSVVANGPLRLRVGNSALFAIPACDLFRDGHVAAFDEIDWPTPLEWIPDAPPEKHLKEITRTTSRASVITLARARALRASLSDPQTPIAGRFAIEIDGMRAGIDVDEIALRTGVLFGRYPRCDINCHNAPMSLDISRVHALFLRVDDCVRVFDTGSTNGVGCDGHDADGLALANDRETRLTLGSEVAITWWPKRLEQIIV